MRDPAMTENQKTKLDVIDRSSDHLLDLINDVLEMSKIEAGRATFEPTSFDLYRTLAYLESILRERAGNKGLELVIERSEDVPRYIRTDERKLRQVLLNLLGNAIKFTQTGKVILRVLVNDHKPAISSQDSPDSQAPQSESYYLRFEVQDTGVGIGPDEMDLLFNAFLQTKSGQGIAEGSGLGLTISQQYVHLMGGEISVESQLGVGSNFSFVIPVELASADLIKPDHPLHRVTGLIPGQPNYRILVVDDSQDNRALLQQMLANTGFEVQTAQSGQAAVEISQSWHPHLIWMDIRMPGIDGYQATRLIKESKGPAPIIIAVTASTFEDERARVLQAGFDDFLRKPFSEADVFERMALHLNIQFTYEVLKPTAATERQKITPADLEGLPEGWVASLRQAATRGRAKELLSLVEQLDENRQPLAKALQAMIDNYEFKQILDLTERDDSDDIG
jgi:two-component system sensor histidine kinase/response regulator